MNRGQLVEAVAKDTGLSKTQTDQVLVSLLHAVQTGVKKDGEVRLVGFGTFSRATRQARKGRNPQTGEAIKIKKKIYPKFKASPAWDPTKAPVQKAAKKVARKAKK